jgi:hypothetical protein
MGTQRCGDERKNDARNGMFVREMDMVERKKRLSNQEKYFFILRLDLTVGAIGACAALHMHSHRSRQGN